MAARTFIALAGGAALTAALSFGCRNTGGANPPATYQTAAQRSAGADGPAGDAAPARIVAEEPESYSATLRLTVESAGEGAASPPRLEAEVARRGRHRRVAIGLPGGERVVYLNRGGTSYVLLPDRGQYAEVASREESFELPLLLMPDRLVDYLKEQNGYVRAGEEELNGRVIVKYVASGEARNGARAGSVAAESVVYVDKLSGLPLRSELVSEAAGGARGLKVVAEMRDVRPDADRGLFVVPRRMKQVESEEVRRQVNSLVNIAEAIAGPLLGRTSYASADTAAFTGR